MDPESLTDASVERECQAPRVGDNRSCKIFVTPQGDRFRQYLFRINTQVIGVAYAIRTPADIDAVENALLTRIEQLNAEALWNHRTEQ